MRPLLVAASLVAIGIPSLAHAMGLAPKAGDATTQTDQLGYLFAAPQQGDWLRFRVSVDGSTLLVKTVGFGAEELEGAANNNAYFETQTQTSGLVSSPVASQQIVGGSLVWKMYVDAADFNDATYLYTFVAGVIKIGDALFRLGSGPGQPIPPAYHQPLQSLVLYGTLPLPDNRTGTVVASQPEDVHVDGKTLHTVHTTVDFTARDIQMATGLPQARVEFWQTTDVPLGVVKIRSTTNGHVYSVDLTAFGRGSYRSVIPQKFDNIPMFPG